MSDYKKDDDIKTYNVSVNLPNYSQRNNEYVWEKKKLIINNASTCNTTSICMAASYAGWKFPKEPFSQYKQEEDRLTAFCLEDPRVSEFYKSILPTFWQEWQDGEKDALPPNQVHRVLEYATNLWFGSTAVTFSETVSIKDILNQVIAQNLPVVVSGVLPKSSVAPGNINHIVVVVGVKFDVVNHEAISIIIDDPWGNVIEGYEKRLPGNDIIIPFDFFKEHFKPVNDLNRKWAYLFKRGAAIV
jgi:hypothetical protein